MAFLDFLLQIEVWKSLLCLVCDMIKVSMCYCGGLHKVKVSRKWTNASFNLCLSCFTKEDGGN